MKLVNVIVKKDLVERLVENAPLHILEMAALNALTPIIWKLLVLLIILLCMDHVLVSICHYLLSIVHN